jgi:SAM-dependent methyltransferase
MTNIYVQYGCGICAPKQWLNFDASPTLRFERLPLIGALYTRNANRFPNNVRFGDIRRGLPIPLDSCQGVYCSHVLEHLALDDFNIALVNTFKYLKPGGTFRFVLPDLEQLARDYLDDKSPQAAIRFMEASFLGTKQRVRGISGFIFAWLKNSAHLWMWDEKAITKGLENHGFINIRRASFGDAEDSRFNEVEEIGRFTGCLAMQCVKPLFSTVGHCA